MDWDNLALAQDQCPPAHAHKLRRMTEFCLQFDSPVVPDPYYGGSQGFEEVLDLVEDACEGLLRHVQRQLQAQGAGVVVRLLAVVLGLGHFHVAWQGHAVLDGQNLGHHAHRDFGRRLAADVDADGPTQALQAGFGL
eukprot:gene30043-38710_t